VLQTTSALPPDDDLIGDLTAPRWKIQSGGKIIIESKDDIKKRLGRSTDTGDSVVMAFSIDANADSYIGVNDGREYRRELAEDLEDAAGGFGDLFKKEW